MDEVKCLDCGADIEVDDTIDIDDEGSYVMMFKVGHCPNCGTDYQWNEYFEFSRFGKLEKA